MFHHHFMHYFAVATAVAPLIAIVGVATVVVRFAKKVILAWAETMREWEA